mmetsp:Transcript_43560/g.115670  ORF Transcript_43560/g.115670 Transcript_43560/m.115670 type:complete len:449 (-) Transcript_43560:958-2304(-)
MFAARLIDSVEVNIWPRTNRICIMKGITFSSFSLRYSSSSSILSLSFSDSRTCMDWDMNGAFFSSIKSQITGAFPPASLTMESARWQAKMVSASTALGSLASAAQTWWITTADACWIPPRMRLVDESGGAVTMYTSPSATASAQSSGTAAATSTTGRPWRRPVRRARTKWCRPSRLPGAPGEAAALPPPPPREMTSTWPPRSSSLIGGSSRPGTLPLGGSQGQPQSSSSSSFSFLAMLSWIVRLSSSFASAAATARSMVSSSCFTFRARCSSRIRASSLCLSRTAWSAWICAAFSAPSLLLAPPRSALPSTRRCAAWASMSNRVRSPCDVERAAAFFRLPIMRFFSSSSRSYLCSTQPNLSGPAISLLGSCTGTACGCCTGAASAARPPGAAPSSSWSRLHGNWPLPGNCLMCVRSRATKMPLVFRSSSAPTRYWLPGNMRTLGSSPG